MTTFPGGTQNDLVLTASVSWSSNTKQIIEDDAKDFEQHDLLATASSLNQPSFFAASETKNDLNVSWGNYFAHKSPPMGQLSGSHGVGQLQRPQFNPKNAQNDQKQPDLELNQEELLNQEADDEAKEHEISMGNMDKQHKTRRAGADELTVGMLDDIDELENEDMVRINIEAINKSMSSIHFGEFSEQYLSNRDSNSTQKSNSSSDSQKISKLIQIPRLKYIQRFCQFKISKEQISDADDEDGIEAKIEALIEKYIESGGCEHEQEQQPEQEQKRASMHLAAITYKRETNVCTALIMFDNECNENADEWIDNFLAYPDIARIVDNEADPIFTQLSSN